MWFGDGVGGTRDGRASTGVDVGGAGAAGCAGDASSKCAMMGAAGCTSVVVGRSSRVPRGMLGRS